MHNKTCRNKCEVKSLYKYLELLYKLARQSTSSQYQSNNLDLNYILGFQIEDNWWEWNDPAYHFLAKVTFSQLAFFTPEGFIIT